MGENGWFNSEGTLVKNAGTENEVVITDFTTPGGFEHVSVDYYGEVVLRTYTITDDSGNVFTQEQYKVLPAECPGDFNQDDAITSSDLGVILAQFGCLVNCPADLSGDGAVLINDVSIFLSLYGFPCE